MKKRSIKTKLLIKMRKLGMICRKQQPHKYELKISHTIIPEGATSPTQAARFVFLQNKVAMNDGCKFNPDIEKCECGADVDAFLIGCENR